MIENKSSDTSNPLSSAFTRIKLSAFISLAPHAGGAWAVDSPAYEGFTFNVVQRCECWLHIAGEPGSTHLHAGDCFLLAGGAGVRVQLHDPSKKTFLF